MSEAKMTITFHVEDRASAVLARLREVMRPTAERDLRQGLGRSTLPW
jgi:hypothetical protein